MADENNNRVSLAAFLKTIRSELAEAAHEAEIHRAELALKHMRTVPILNTKEIKLEIEVTAEASDSSKAGAKIYVLSGELSEQTRNTAKQKVTIVLEPATELSLGSTAGVQEAPTQVTSLSADSSATDSTDRR